jgi:hypothetical protein
MYDLEDIKRRLAKLGYPPPASMNKWTINSLEEAKEVFAYHTRQQRYEGILKRPLVYFTDNAVVFVIEASRHPTEIKGMIQITYEYNIYGDTVLEAPSSKFSDTLMDKIRGFAEAKCWLQNINRRTDRTRWKDETEAVTKRQRPRKQKERPRTPLKQLHMFDFA